MKIVDVQAYTVKTPTPSKGGRYWFFIKLTTDDGITGWGEAFWHTYGAEAFEHAVKDVSELYVIDKNPFDIEVMWQKIFMNHCRQHPDLSKVGILSGIEIACWDIIGKALDKPVYELMGGKYNERLWTYTYIYPEENGEWNHEESWKNPEASAKIATQYRDQGFTAVKIDPLPEIEHHAPPWSSPLYRLERAEKTVAAVRDAVGSTCEIILGTHGQFTGTGAVRLAKRLEKYNLMWFEEPVPPGNSEVMRRVKQETSIPVCAGERIATKFEAIPLLTSNAVDIMQIDVAGGGGILEGKKIAALCEAFHVPITPHLWAGPISLAAEVQLGVCTPNFLIQECIEKNQGFHSEILSKMFEWQDGYIIPTSLPGLGIEIDEEKLLSNVVGHTDERNPLLND